MQRKLHTVFEKKEEGKSKETVDIDQEMVNREVNNVRAG